MKRVITIAAVIAATALILGSTTYLAVQSAKTSTSASASTLMPQGATYLVQSSYDCLARSAEQTFNVTVASRLQGAISTGSPGVTLYVATAQEAETTSLGHPATWVYSSGLTNSTTFSIPLTPGSYVLWTEGADLGCGATIITPLEQLTTVTVTQAVVLIPT